mmetsp:Transcript_15266/g.18020  ORF Transcript_15266/g.18020 Transcript_15266/m.18020 type:complete len:264 (-) Transcript_15266:2020-2811(-)
MSGSKSKVSILYYIPEDGDTENYPNVFVLSSKNGGDKNRITLGEIKKSFPLPGAYHFRFKKSFKNTYVWLDVSNDEDFAPVHDGVIISKVSRLSIVRSASPTNPNSISNPMAINMSEQRNNISSEKDLLGINSSSPSSVDINGNKTSVTVSSNSSSTNDFMDLDWSIPTPASASVPIAAVITPPGGTPPTARSTPPLNLPRPTPVQPAPMHSRPLTHSHSHSRSRSHSPATFSNTTLNNNVRTTPKLALKTGALNEMAKDFTL